MEGFAGKSRTDRQTGRQTVLVAVVLDDGD